MSTLIIGEYESTIPRLAVTVLVLLQTHLLSPRLRTPPLRLSVRRQCGRSAVPLQQSTPRHGSTAAKLRAMSSEQEQPLQCSSRPAASLQLSILKGTAIVTLVPYMILVTSLFIFLHSQIDSELVMY
jgi:hypothetical protein